MLSDPNELPVKSPERKHSLFGKNPFTSLGGVVRPLQNHFPSIVTESQRSIELVEKPSRSYFSLDVKPEQKDIHKSDQFNQRDQSKTNGYVARVQGVKKPEQQRVSVWPKVHVCAFLRKASV